MKTLFRAYEYITPEGRKGSFHMLLAVEFGPEAQEIYRLSFSSSCSDAIMRHARDAILQKGFIWYDSSYEGGFNLNAGLQIPLHHWSYSWRRHVDIQGDTYSLGTGGYGLDVQIGASNSHWIYWKPEVLTYAQINDMTEVQREFLRKLRIYEELLTMGLKLLGQPNRFDTCEQLLDTIFNQQTSHPWAFNFMERAGAGRYKP